MLIGRSRFEPNPSTTDGYDDEGMTSVPPWLAVLSLGAVACTEAGPAPKLLRVEPAHAFSDRDERVSLFGELFVPAYQVAASGRRRDAHALGFTGLVGSGKNVAFLKDFGWVSEIELTATLGPGLPAGVHTVQITDPRGHTTVLPDGFTALGHDSAAPLLTIDSPDAKRPFAPGIAIETQLTATDSPGVVTSVTWVVSLANRPILSGACLVPVRAQDLTCRFAFTIPANGNASDALRLVATATDGANPPNRTSATFLATLQAPPRAFQITPHFGGIAGGTEVVIRGEGFLPGTQVLIDSVPLVPSGGVRVNDQTMTGRMPAHRPGPATVVLRTPIGESIVPQTFDFRSPPEILSLDPAVGPASGGTIVKVFGQRFSEDTVILFGPSLVSATGLLSPRYVGPREIVGQVPGGNGITAVWAFDPATGFTRLGEAFAYLP